MTAISTSAITPGRQGLMGRLSDLFWRRPNLLLVLMLVPPLLWLGITFVFVTHDQGEALSMADRVAVFNDGKIVQAGTPHEIYNRPRTRFVADFVGSSNVIAPEAMKALGGEACWTSLRPEAIRIVSEGGIEETVRSTSFLGASTKLFVETAVAALTISLPAGQAAPQTGESIRIVWSPADPHYMEAGA